MTKKLSSNRPRVIFLALQIMAALAMLMGTVAAVHLGAIGIDVFCGRWDCAEPFCTPLNAALGLTILAAVSLCSYAALALFISMCQRLKRDTAFTPANVATLRRIAQSCGIAGVAATGAGIWMWGHVMPFPVLMLGFLYLALALMAYTLHLLLHQAVAIQQENELTV